MPYDYTFVIKYEYRRAPSFADEYRRLRNYFDSLQYELTEAQKKKKFICRHWIRPKFLQYRYIYNYRKNYYDDVINYLDKRNKGLTFDAPRAQTWAERALRTYNADIDRTGEYIRSFGIRLHPDLHEGSRKKYVNPYHAEHSHDYYHRKYYTALYGAVI